MALARQTNDAVTGIPPAEIALEHN
ncbi:protein of unknown function [Shinella sp. WSC3-e]|nr:protein of unknown function [Shinella sp. WSC3-e]